MTQKPEIQYIGQFYVYGSEAREAELKEKKARVHLPKPKLEHIQKIYIDPVALGGILVAVLTLIVMAIGAVQLNQSWKEYNAVENHLKEVKWEHAKIEHAYRTSFDIEKIRSNAEGIGMIPSSEAKVMKVRVTVPEHKTAPTTWDNVKWFVRGLVD